MKKISVLVLVTVIMAIGVAQASNVERIKEVTQIGEQAVKNIELYQAEIRKQENTIVWANAVIGELRAQDAAVEKAARQVEAIAKESEAEAKVAEIERAMALETPEEVL